MSTKIIDRLPVIARRTSQRRAGGGVSAIFSDIIAA
jgi:hypothetical protein